MAQRRMRFRTWAKKDPNDNRKINYTFTNSNGKTTKFTSEDDIDITLFMKVTRAWIKKIELVNNEWYAELYED